MSSANSKARIPDLVKDMVFYGPEETEAILKERDPDLPVVAHKEKMAVPDGPRDLPDML